MAKNRNAKKPKQEAPKSQQRANAPGYGDKKLEGPNSPAE